jgi:hypothetical protein
VSTCNLCVAGCVVDGGSEDEVVSSMGTLMYDTKLLFDCFLEYNTLVCIASDTSGEFVLESTTCDLNGLRCCDANGARR